MEANPGFQAILLVLVGFLYKTAQKPLKNRSKLAWKTVQKSPQEMSGFWAVFLARFEQFEQFFQKKNAQTTQTAQILLENRSNHSYLERFLSGISTRARITDVFCQWQHFLKKIDLIQKIKLDWSLVIWLFYTKLRYDAYVKKCVSMMAWATM